MNNRKRGFTLIELMVTISVLAILMTIAAPNLQTLLQNSRLSSQASGLVGDLSFARAEALKLGSPVAVCASADGATCSGATNWETGWIVFNDANSSSAVDGAETPLRVTPALTGNNTMGAGRPLVRFSPQGYSVGFTTTFSACDSRGAASARSVVLNNQGRVTSGLGGAVCP